MDALLKARVQREQVPSKRDVAVFLSYASCAALDFADFSALFLSRIRFRSLRYTQHNVSLRQTHKKRIKNQANHGDGVPVRNIQTTAAAGATTTICRVAIPALGCGKRGKRVATVDFETSTGRVTLHLIERGGPPSINNFAALLKSKETSDGKQRRTHEQSSKKEEFHKS
jgi:hypothetical protein